MGHILKHWTKFWILGILLKISTVLAQNSGTGVEEDSDKTVSWIIIALIILLVVFICFWIAYFTFCKRKCIFSCCCEDGDDEEAIEKSQLIPKTSITTTPSLDHGTESPDPYHLHQTSSLHPLRRGSESGAGSPSPTSSKRRTLKPQKSIENSDNSELEDSEDEENGESISKTDRIRRTIYVEDSKTGEIRSRSISPNPYHPTQIQRSPSPRGPAFDIITEPKMTTKRTSIH